MGLDLPGVALVTGAGGAIGQACVLQFARDGVTKIVGIDLGEVGLLETASKLYNEFPMVEFEPLIADLSNEEQVKLAFEKAINRFDRIDYAVNNAAIAGPLTRTSETDSLAFDRVLGINLKGVWLCERLELNLMLKQSPLKVAEGALNGRIQSRGSIINIGSVLSHLAVPVNGLYTVSKHGLLGLTRADALDYAKQGIRINVICPGFVDTPLVTPKIKALLQPSIDKTPIGRLAQPQEIADGVVFLSSDRASYITGSSLTIDGGYSIN